MSDSTAVLAKAIVPTVVLPSIAFTLSVVVQVMLLFFRSAVLAANGLSPAPVWVEFRFFENLVIMLYGLTVHALWFAPIYAWLLLISGWAKRAPVLWAVLPLLAISAVERIAFNTWSFMTMLQYRIGGAMQSGFASSPDAHGDITRIAQLTPLKFLGTPGLWLGLLFAAACVGAAVRLRRHREPI